MQKKILLLYIYLFNLYYIKLSNCLSEYLYKLKIRKRYFISPKCILKVTKINSDDKYKLSKIKIKHANNKKLIKTYSLINSNIGEIKKKKKIIIGNWKCYLSKEQAYKLIDTITQIKYSSYIDLIISPNLLYIPYLQQKIKENNSKIITCSQDVSLVNGFGPFTGETTAKLIYDFGNKYTIIGHSERKKGFYNNVETIEQTVLKVYNAIHSKLKVILCVGEDYDYTNFHLFSSKIKELLSIIKKKISKNEMKNIIIAFEPNFAIGTGKSVSYNILNDCCLDIKKNIANEISPQISDDISIVFGGSINKSNMKNYIGNTISDGFLIGKASLDETFIDIIKYVDQYVLSNI
ncbi:triosephosphate isomerase, putative [Plasmodium gallinaceum]|uniref:Triosephosphate isomerase n=1 Tax=Plasmodium gallinaceum TaxID=5849 RepID=A0A1J1GP51_PLAGA|nr:triosephosphate isomerase, putative [Plasmodium gallinaceum]CRG94271.1 triosephosphate isomerase, putative [Plasmodium gallinaceum]